MLEKQRRAVVQNIIKNLLELEIPEIQTMASRLAEQIKKLEEHSFKLQEYVTQIERLATEEASALAESRISEILKELDNALSELKQRSKKAAAISSGDSTPSEITETGQTAEQRIEELEVEHIVSHRRMKPEAYTTPEGYLIRKSRH